MKGLVWFTDGSKMMEGTGAGVYGQSLGRRLSIPVGKHATVFQAEVYAILACVMKFKLKGDQRSMLVFSLIARQL